MTHGSVLRISGVNDVLAIQLSLYAGSHSVRAVTGRQSNHNNSLDPIGILDVFGRRERFSPL